MYRRMHLLDTAIGRFINSRDSEVTVCVDYVYGGTSCVTLRHRGDYWDLHLRTTSPYDVYCWNTAGVCTPNGSLTCVGGNTYHVG
jgi:hypothetical protein